MSHWYYDILSEIQVSEERPVSEWQQSHSNETPIGPVLSALLAAEFEFSRQSSKQQRQTRGWKKSSFILGHSNKGEGKILLKKS